MNITIDKDTRIASPTDGMNWTVEKRVVAGDKARIPGEISWKGIGYFPTCEMAARSLLGKVTPEVDMSIEEMTKVYKEMGQRIADSCECGLYPL